MELCVGDANRLQREANAYLDALNTARSAQATVSSRENNLRTAMRELEVQVIVVSEDEVIVAEAADNWTSKVKVYGDVARLAE